MKITTAAQLDSRNSNIVRALAQVPLARATSMFSEHQILSMHSRAGNTRFAATILGALEETERNYRLCSVLRDIKHRAQNTLSRAAAFAH